jgi:hypothetical protein
MELNFISNTCQPSSPSSFEVQFKNTLGEPVNESLSSYVVRDGVVPKCIHDGFNPLGKRFGDESHFYVLPGAQIYVPDYPENERIVTDYCIDTEKSNGSDMVKINYIFIIFK